MGCRRARPSRLSYAGADPAMKASVLCFLGYAAALTGIASHYDLGKYAYTN